jgi:hypothetical protein
MSEKYISYSSFRSFEEKYLSNELAKLNSNLEDVVSVICYLRNN